MIRWPRLDNNQLTDQGAGMLASALTQNKCQLEHLRYDIPVGCQVQRLPELSLTAA